jgi:hypothetical protein
MENSAKMVSKCRKGKSKANVAAGGNISTYHPRRGEIPKYLLHIYIYIYTYKYTYVETSE